MKPVSLIAIGYGDSTRALTCRGRSIALVIGWMSGRRVQSAARIVRASCRSPLSERSSVRKVRSGGAAA